MTTTTPADDATRIREARANARVLGLTLRTDDLLRYPHKAYSLWRLPTKEDIAAARALGRPVRVARLPATEWLSLEEIEGFITRELERI